MTPGEWREKNSAMDDYGECATCHGKGEVYDTAVGDWFDCRDCDKPTPPEDAA